MPKVGQPIDHKAVRLEEELQLSLAEALANGDYIVTEFQDRHKGDNRDQIVTLRLLSTEERPIPETMIAVTLLRTRIVRSGDTTGEIVIG